MVIFLGERKSVLSDYFKADLVNNYATEVVSRVGLSFCLNYWRDGDHNIYTYFPYINSG